MFEHREYEPIALRQRWVRDAWLLGRGGVGLWGATKGRPMGRHDLSTDETAEAGGIDDVTEDIEAELAVGEREACSVGFGFASDVRVPFAAVRPQSRAKRR